MNGLMKKLTVALALAVMICGCAFAQTTEGQLQSGATFIVEDTMRDMLTTLHSRLDAFRKVQLPVAATPAPETVTNVVAPAAYGSLVAQTPADCTVPLPDYACGERYLNRIWGGGIGTWQNADKRFADIDGYKYEGQGVMLGIDRAAGAATFGMAASYVKGKYENKLADEHNSDIMQYSGHVYATYNNSRGFFFSVAGGYTFSDNELDERADTGGYAIADYKAHTFTGSVRMGFDFEPSDSVVITPSIGGTYFHSKTRDHIEDRDITGIQQVEYANIKHNQIEIPFDITIAKEFYFGANKMLQFAVNGGYAYNLNDKALAGDYAITGGTTDRIDGRRLGHHAWKGGAGLRLKMDQWDIGAKYDYLGRNDYNSHRVLGTVGFSF